MNTRPEHVPAARRLVPAAPVLQHLRQLRGAGAKRGQIAAAADVDPQTISAFLARPPASTHRHFAAAVLAVTSEAATAAPLGGRVPSRGARRRLQALYAHGWSFEDQAARAGIELVELRRLLAGRQFVDPRLDVAMRQLHRELWAVEPPAPTARARRTLIARRARARRLGYVPTLAWDDIARDDAPPEVPADDDVDEVAIELALAGEPVGLRTQELAAVRQLRPSRRRRGLVAA